MKNQWYHDTSDNSDTCDTHDTSDSCDTSDTCGTSDTCDTIVILNEVHNDVMMMYSKDKIHIEQPLKCSRMQKKSQIQQWLDLLQHEV